MIGYHVTTTAKLRRYYQTGAILPPVRFWLYPRSARAWAKKTGRDVILAIQLGQFARAHPLPDHQPRGHAYWTPEIVRLDRFRQLTSLELDGAEPQQAARELSEAAKMDIMPIVARVRNAFKAIRDQLWCH